MDVFSLEDHTHRRLNVLTGDWVLVSPHRMKRPWQGKTEVQQKNDRSQYDPNCYLCPGNTRAQGSSVNPKYTSTFVFKNDFSAIQSDIPKGKLNESELLVANSERGICKVICYSPRHDLTMGKMTVSELLEVINLWTKEYEELGALAFINYVQIFENKGTIMGCSNLHPHGQIWAQESLSTEVQKETIQQLAYWNKHQRTLIADYLELELKKEERIVYENDHFAVLIPFWATWPYETMLISKRAIQSLVQLTPSEQIGLADALQQLTACYDLVFDCSFPYSMGLHQAPTDGLNHLEWHFHIHFYPPLLRSATVKKFMVGYEMMGEPQRDLTAEFIAKKLRALVSR